VARFSSFERVGDDNTLMSRRKALSIRRRVGSKSTKKGGTAGPWDGNGCRSNNLCDRAAGRSQGASLPLLFAAGQKIRETDKIESVILQRVPRYVFRRSTYDRGPSKVPTILPPLVLFPPISPLAGR